MAEVKRQRDASLVRNIRIGQSHKRSIYTHAHYAYALALNSPNPSFRRHAFNFSIASAQASSPFSKMHRSLNALSSLHTHIGHFALFFFGSVFDCTDRDSSETAGVSCAFPMTILRP